MSLPLSYSVRNLGRSPLRLGLVVGSAALVAGLVIAAVGFVRGMNAALGSSGLERNVLVLGTGSEESIERSEIDPSVSTLLETDIDGVASVGGALFVSPEVHVALPITEGVTAVFRGITPAAFLVHPQVRTVEGTVPERGTDGLMLGRAAAQMLDRAGLPSGVGQTLTVGGRSMPIVGTFTAPGTVMEGEIWAERDALKLLTKRATDSCVVVTMGSGDPADLEAFAATRIELELATVGEPEYFAALSRFLAPVRWLVVATALIVSIGGLLGGISALDAAFASRIRELGTLQAIGFRRRAILRSMLAEALLATLAGGLIAGTLALALVDGAAVRSSMGSFAIRVDPVAIASGLLAAVVLALLGTAVPAIRTLRRAVPDALRGAA
jgi:putative ABC transport system permease protein